MTKRFELVVLNQVPRSRKIYSSHGVPGYISSIKCTDSSECGLIVIKFYVVIKKFGEN